MLRIIRSFTLAASGSRSGRSIEAELTKLSLAAFSGRLEEKEEVEEEMDRVLDTGVEAVGGLGELSRDGDFEGSLQMITILFSRFGQSK